MAASKKRLRADLLKYLLDFLQQHASPGQHLLLGLSGGLDSCVLLDLLVQARRQFDFHLSAIYVDHGLSPNTKAWAGFCGKLCRTQDAVFQHIQVEVKRDSGLGLEAAAREARYRVLLAQPVDAILLAHHRDDQAETLLLQLLRGAGVHGLAAMPPAMLAKTDPLAANTGNKRFLRPLLDFPRSDLLGYAQARHLEWIDDESNFDCAYDRNFLRQHILPELEKRFPACGQNLARSAAHLGEAAELLDEVAAQDALSAVKGGRLNIEALGDLTTSRAKNLMRWWVKTQTGNAPSAAKLQEILEQMHARPDAQVCLTLGELFLRRYRKWASIEARTEPLEYVREWRGEALLELPGHGRLSFKECVGGGIALPTLRKSQLSIRSRAGGEHFQPDAKRPRRSLKNLFQEAGIPPWQRVMMPLIYLDEKLVFVPMLGVAHDYQAGPNEPGMKIEWSA